MPEFYFPTTSIDELRQKMKDEIQCNDLRLQSDDMSSYQKSQLEHINFVLNNAETMTQPRLVLPHKLRHVPILGSRNVQKILLKIYNFLFKEQRSINLATIHSIRQSLLLHQNLCTQLSEQTSNTIHSLELNTKVGERIDNVDERIDNVDERIDNIVRQVNDLTRQIGAIETSFTSLRNFINQIETRLGRMDRTIKFLENNYGDRLRYLQTDLTNQKRLITIFQQQQQQHKQDMNCVPCEIKVEEESQSISSPLQLEVDTFYRALEDKFRGTPSQIRERLQNYLPFLEKTTLHTSGDLIVDIGCGRGEWLQLLKDYGYNSVGLDINQVMLEQCQGMGLSVVASDALAYLSALPDKSVGGVTGFHIVEHLPFEYLIQIMAESYRVVRPGGIVIFETQNPHNVLVGTCNFYFDPTHNNPIPPELLQFMAQYSGFSMAKILPLNPSDNPHVSEDSDLAVRFNQLFYGSMDYAVIGIKE